MIIGIMLNIITMIITFVAITVTIIMPTMTIILISITFVLITVFILTTSMIAVWLLRSLVTLLPLCFWLRGTFLLRGMLEHSFLGLGFDNTTPHGPERGPCRRGVQEHPGRSSGTSSAKARRHLWLEVGLGSMVLAGQRASMRSMLHSCEDLPQFSRICAESSKSPSRGPVLCATKPAPTHGRRLSVPSEFGTFRSKLAKRACSKSGWCLLCRYVFVLK